MATVEENIKPVRQAFESLKKLDPAGVERVVHAKLQGNVRQQMELVRSVFPDLQITLEDVIAQNDKVVTRWIARGTHTGEGTMRGLGRIKPTGKPMTVEGITIHRIENGKIVETWGVTEKLEAMIELGLIGEGRQ
jgi:predicted ester cyclase